MKYLWIAVLLGACQPQPQKAVLTAPYRDTVIVVTADKHTTRCVFRTMSDSSRFILWPPTNHPQRLACLQAFNRWTQR